MENFLTYGKWDLTDADIEKLNKDEERKERVGVILLKILLPVDHVVKWLSRISMEYWTLIFLCTEQQQDAIYTYVHVALQCGDKKV